jgi:hypothetical protein
MQNTETGGLTRGERSAERDDQIESRHSLSNHTELMESYPTITSMSERLVRLSEGGGLNTKQPSKGVNTSIYNASTFNEVN